MLLLFGILKQNIDNFHQNGLIIDVTQAISQLLLILIVA